MKHVNMLVKLTDAKMKDVKTALTDAGIIVRSVVVLHEEEIQEAQAEGEKSHAADAAVPTD